MKSNKKKIKRPTSENVIIITISSMLEYFNFKPNNKESQADQLSNQTKNYLGQPITKNSYDKDWQIVYKTNEDAMKNSGEF